MLKKEKGISLLILIIIIVIILAVVGGGIMLLTRQSSNENNNNNLQQNNNQNNNTTSNTTITMKSDYFYSVKPIGRTFGQRSDGARYSNDVIQLRGTGTFKNSDEFKSKNVAEQATAMRIESKINNNIVTSYVGISSDATQDTLEFNIRIEIPWKYQFENAVVDVEIFLFNKSVGKLQINTLSNVKPLKDDVTVLEGTNKVRIAGTEVSYKAMVSKKYPLSGTLTGGKYRLMILFEAENNTKYNDVFMGVDYYILYKYEEEFKGYREVYPNWLTELKNWGSDASGKGNLNTDKPKDYLISTSIGDRDASKITEVTLYVTTVDGTYQMTLPVEYVP